MRREYDISHHEAQRKHAQQRLRQRFGIDLRDQEYNQLVHDFRFYPESGRFEFLGRQSNRISFFKFFLAGHTVVGVYDRKTKQFRTFLTEEMFKNTALKTETPSEGLWPKAGTLAGVDTETGPE